MIGPCPDFPALLAAAGIDGMGSAPRNGLSLPDPGTIVAYATAAAVRHGIEFQAYPATGHFLVCPMPDGSLRNLARVARYVLARPDEAEQVAEAIIDDVARQCGPGRAWSLAGHVHVAGDEGWARAVEIGGAMHVVFRSWICHENGPRHEDGAA